MNKSSESPHERPHKFRRLVLALACLATIVVIFYAEEDLRGKWAWNKFKKEWQAKGETFDKSTFIPAAVPADQNFALTPVVSSSYGRLLTRDGKVIPIEKRDTNLVDRMVMPLDADDTTGPTNGIGDWRKGTISDLKPWQDYYRILPATTNLFPISAQAQTPAQDVLLALSKYDSTIEELREASRLPYARFPLAYDVENPAVILIPHLADLKRCSQVLQLRAIAELQNGQSDKALDDVKLTFRLIDSVRREPSLISGLVRLAMTVSVLQPVYEGLAQHEWAEAQLAEIDAELAKLDFVSDYQFCMRAEMVFYQQGIFDYIRRHPEELFSYEAVYDAPSGWPKVACRLIPSGWFYQNETHCARFMVEHFIPVADLKQQTISPSKVEAAIAALNAETQHFTPYNIIERLLLPALAKSALRFGYAQTSVNLARNAIALERFYAANKTYPNSLIELTPQYIHTLSHDTVNGQAFRYRRTNDIPFVLYSVGWNESDDGGEVVLRDTGAVNSEEGDWVWQYPAQ